MNTLRWLRLCALCGVACSAAAAVDQYLGAPAFCATLGGCEALARSSMGQLLGPYLPGLGVGGFSALFWASMAPRAEVRRLVLLGGIGAGLLGAGLLVLQWVEMADVCLLCLGADLSGIAVALTSGVALRRRPNGATSWPLAAWTALFVFAAAAPGVYAMARPVPVPDHVQAQWKPDKLNVVEISDFQCPYCRRVHGPLGEAMRAYGDDVHFVRLSYPLAGHRHARDAARAYLCGVQQGRGEAVADALFSMDLAELDGPTMAAQVGIEPRRFAQCLKAPQTDRQIDATMAKVKAGGMSGLPTVYVGHERLLGYDEAAGSAPYAAALQRASRRQRPTHRPAPWIALGLLLLGLVSVSSRVRPSRGKSSP